MPNYYTEPAVMASYFPPTPHTPSLAGLALSQDVGSASCSLRVSALYQNHTLDNMLGRSIPVDTG